MSRDVTPEQERQVRDTGYCFFHDLRVEVPATMNNFPLSMTEFPNCPRVVEALREDEHMLIGDIPQDLRRLQLMRGVGQSAIRKFVVNLQEVVARHGNEPPLDLQTGHVLVIFDHTIGVPDCCLNVLLDNTAFSHGVEKILIYLAAHGIDRIKDMPRQLDEYLLKLPGVGRTKVEKFAEELAEFIGNQVKRAESNKILLLREENLVLPMELLDVPLETAGFSVVQNWFCVHGFSEVKTLRDLPEDWRSYSAEEIATWVQELKRWVAELEFTAAKDRFWQLIQRIIDDQMTVDVKEEHWKIFRTRVVGTPDGKTITLEQISHELHLTRERVRQICKKAGEKILKPHGAFFNWLRYRLEQRGGLLPVEELLGRMPDDNFERSVVRSLFEMFDIFYEADIGLIHLLSREEYGKLIADFGQHLHQHLSVAGISDRDLEKAGETFSQNLNQSPVAMVRIGQKHFLRRGKYGYRFRSLNKAEMLTYVLYKYFPQGLALYKDFDRFAQHMNEEFDNEFREDTKRSIIAALQREERDVYLWGLGYYIHRAHIRVGREDLQPVADWTRAYFTRGMTQLSAYKPFETHREYLTEHGVPNEYALYSCLRRYFAEDFYLPRTPWIFPAYVRERHSLTDAVESYAWKQGTEVSYEQLKDEFVQQRGWREYMLQQAISASVRLLRVNFGRYIHVDALQSNHRFLFALVTMMKERLENDKYVSVSKVYMERQEECRQFGLSSPVLAYNVLRYHFAGELYFPKFPIVQDKAGETAETITCRQLVEEYLEQAGEPVPRSLLKERFEKELGWERRLLDDAIFSSPMVVPVSAGHLYVHRAVLGWDGEKQQELENFLLELLEDKMEQGHYFISLGQLILEDFAQLPDLAQGLVWTADMLSFLAAEIQGLLILGTRKQVLMMMHNGLQVENEMDFIAYILERQFSGRAKVRELEQALHGIGLFSSEFPESYRRDKDQLPYKFLGNEIILKNR